MKKPDYELTVISSNDISWGKYPEGGYYGSTDMSILDAGGRRRAFNRVWKDSADLGFIVRSERTGKEQIFFLYTDNPHSGKTATATMEDGQQCVITIFNT